MPEHSPHILRQIYCEPAANRDIIHRRNAANLRLEALSRFWSHPHEIGVSARQRLVLERTLDDDQRGFLTAPKYAKLANTSLDTAQRDIADLARKHLIARNPGGSKKTSYSLRTFDDWA
jgi:Fic family protein